MKGEINNEFEAFYLAKDNEGQVYLNRNPGYGNDRYNKTNGWQQILPTQLDEYRKVLHFITLKIKIQKR